MNKTFNNLEEVIEFIKSKVQIANVMSGAMELTQAGPDLLKGLCCFHAENTPSMTVTPSKGMYYCFGCHAGGDAITFMKEFHNMSTTESIYHLAEQFQLDVSQFERELTEEEKYKRELKQINKTVRDHLNGILLEDRRASEAYSYLTEERKLTDDVLKEFGIGYSEHIGDSMMHYSGSYAEVLELDKPQMWSTAAIYPLHDAYGGVIGFKTRPFRDRQTDERGHKLPKFLGTSTRSPLHEEGHLYGLHIARKNLKNGRLLGMEGQNDVLKSHVHNIKNVVGIDGTTLNEQKLRLLEEFGVREFILILDGDAAGREMSLKVAESVSNIETRVTVKIGTMPDGLDPDEFLDAYGSIAMLGIVNGAVYPSQYLVDNMIANMGLETVTQKLDFVNRVQPILSKCTALEQKFLIAYIGTRIGIDSLIIEDVMRSQQAQNAQYVMHNIGGERIVLGAMTRDDEFRQDVIGMMNKQDWYLPKHQELFEMVKEMEISSVPINTDTLKITMNNKGLGKLFNEGRFIDEVMAAMGDYRSLIDDLMDKAIRRKLVREAEELQRGAKNLKTQVFVVAEEHASKIHNAMTVSSSPIVDSKKGASTFMENLHKRMLTPGAILGVPLGNRWKSANKVLSGLRKKLLITIAANQSVGKTTLLSNWLEDIAIENKQPWLHFSLEMPAEQVTHKIINLRAGVNSMDTMTGNVSQEDYDKISKAATEYYNGNLLINDTATTLEQIISETRAAIRKHNIVGISIDYIQLMQKEKSKSRVRYEELGEISGGLKNDLAKALNIPCVILSQLSKSALDKAVAKAEDGSGAYKIAQDSDVYIILQEKNEEEIEQWGIKRGNMKLNIDKNREGRSDVLLDVYFERHTQRMMEINN